MWVHTKAYPLIFDTARVTLAVVATTPFDVLCKSLNMLRQAGFDIHVCLCALHSLVATWPNRQNVGALIFCIRAWMRPDWQQSDADSERTANGFSPACT